MRHRSFALALCGALCISSLACQPESQETGGNSGSGGSGGKGSGGSAGSGGKGSGGSAGSGGTTNSGGSAGGAGKGGSQGRGGEVGSGGARDGGSSGTGGKGGVGGANSGGTSSSGGAAGSGGQGGGTGGGTGQGGTAGSGGATGRGGATGAGGSVAGTTGTSSCTFTQQATLSSKIGTVGIVTWSTTQSNLTEANIDFGLTTSYGYTAPVDLKATDHRTLLLGMKPTKTYNYRIRAKNSSGECTSPNYTLQTGSLLNGLSKITVSNKSTASPLSGGFLLVGQFTSGGMSSGSPPAYILDADGEYVWAYGATGDAAGVRMSYAGDHLWVNAVNVGMGTGSGNATVHRISMDGLTDENLSSKFTGQNHQITPFSADGTNETVAFYAYGSNGCEDIKEYSPSTGNVKTIVNAGTAQGGSSACHVNNIQYSKDDDTLVYSDLDSQVIVKVKRTDGSTVWVLNGSKSTFTGDTWKGGQHGIHLLGVDRLLFFNNNSTVNMGGGFGAGSGSAGGDGSGSIAIELKLDVSAKKMTKAWSYKASPGLDNQVMGDVQRLPNGNTIVAFSTKGVLHEVSSSGTLLQELSWAAGGQFGYIEKRASLYGPPTR